MKQIALLASLIAAFPMPQVQAKTLVRVYGNLAGLKYCQLRQAGVSHDDALTFAIRDNLSVTGEREPVFRTASGQETTNSAVTFANFVSSMCPQYWPSGEGGNGLNL